MNVRDHRLLRITYAVSTLLIITGLAVAGVSLLESVGHGDYYLYGGIGVIAAAGFLFLFGVTLASLESASSNRIQ